LRPDVGAALEHVPRERFVPVESIAFSADDVALPLTEDGAATISSLDSYARMFALLDLSPGDALVELGSGTGYGAALAAEIVGAGGRVLALEIDGELASDARENLAQYPQVEVRAADAHHVDEWSGARKVACCFALESLPGAWSGALAEGAVLVAPIGSARQQRLVRFEKRGDALVPSEHERVLYVADRGQRPASERTRARQASGTASSEVRTLSPK
ncbi:MAG TPA: methyltransferase domain-containing protein, partial [Polyangiaceae bacterium]